MEAAEAKEILVGFDNLFHNMTPDAAIVFLMFVVLLKKLVDKGILERDEVFDLSIRAGELFSEVESYLQ